MAASLSCIFSCTLASLLTPFLGFLSLLGFFSEMVSALCWKLVFLLWAFAGGGYSCKTGQNAVRFCLLLFAWVRSVLGLCPKKGTENRTERTPGCSGWSSAPFFMVFASLNGQSRTAGVRSCVTVGFYGFSFSEGSVLCYKFRQANRAC